MFYEAFDEYKNEAVFIKLMEGIQNMECSYFKSECYNIPPDCEVINEQQFRRMLKNARIFYSSVRDVVMADTLFYEAFGRERKCRYYKDEIDNIKNYLYTKSIDYIVRFLKNRLSIEITDDNTYKSKMAVIESAINGYYKAVTIDNPDNTSYDGDFTIDTSFKPEFRKLTCEINNNIEKKATSPLEKGETIAICNYKLFEINRRNNGIFDYAAFKIKQNSFNDFKEIINLLSFDFYCSWVKDFMESEHIEADKIENAFSKLPVEEIWDCVIADVMINSYIDICMWNDGKEFQCSFKNLYCKFEDEFIHYTSTKNDEDIPLIKEFIDNQIDLNSKIKAAIRIRDNFRKINKFGYVTNFFNNIPFDLKKKIPKKLPNFSMPMIFGLLMYKYSFGRIKSTASDVSCRKLCECINCYTEITLRNISMKKINKRDIYEAQYFIEKYLLNLVYNINGIVRYSSCNFTSNELKESYYNKLVCNKYILTYQKLCSLQSNIDVDISYFMNNEILNKFTEIITYIFTLIKESTIKSYRKIIKSFALYLVNDPQSPKSLIPRKIYMKDDSSNLSAEDYAKIFGFNYYNTPKKRNKRYSKSSHTRTKIKASTTEPTTRKSLAEKLIERMENSKNKE